MLRSREVADPKEARMGSNGKESRKEQEKGKGEKLVMLTKFYLRYFIKIVNALCSA